MNKLFSIVGGLVVVCGVLYSVFRCSYKFGFKDGRDDVLMENFKRLWE